MSKAQCCVPKHAKRHPRFAKSDDDVSFQRDVRERRTKVGGC
jgi:hypothetical protein